MKKYITIFVLVLSSLFGAQCTITDDDYYSRNNVELIIEDALKIEDNENYTVGDVLYFELNFSRYLPEEGETTLLDVYETSGANQFYYDFSFFKFSTLSEDYQWLPINEKFIVAEKGALEDSNQVSVIFNEETNMYESKIGIILAEEGEYQIDFNSLYLYGNNDPEKPTVQIENISTNDTPLLLEFTVSN